MSGDLPIRKARTKREKNKSYNDSRMRFRASLKANSNENAPSEEDEKIEEKKMKVGEAEAAIEQPTIDDNMSDDGAKAPIIKQDVNEHEDKVDGGKPEEDEDISVTKEQKATIVNEEINSEVNNVEKSAQTATIENEEINSEVNNVEKSAAATSDENDPTKEICEYNSLKEDHNSGGEGSGTTNTSAEGPSKEKTAEELAMDSDALWDEIFFESEEEGKPIHQKGSKKYFKEGIPTPPAKTTSEEDTDDEEKGDDSDDTDSQNDIDDKEEDKDMDDEGNGGSNASTEDNKDEDASGDAAGNDEPPPPDDKNEDNMEHDAPQQEENVNNKDNTDKINVGDDGNKDVISEDFNIEGAVDPYDIDYDDEPDYSSSNDYDPYEFLSQDGGSGVEDNSYYSGEEEHDYTEDVVEVRGAG